MKFYCGNEHASNAVHPLNMQKLIGNCLKIIFIVLLLCAQGRSPTQQKPHKANFGETIHPSPTYEAPLSTTHNKIEVSLGPYCISNG